LWLWVLGWKPKQMISELKTFKEKRISAFFIISIFKGHEQKIIEHYHAFYLPRNSADGS